MYLCYLHIRQAFDAKFPTQKNEVVLYGRIKLSFRITIIPLGTILFPSLPTQAVSLTFRNSGEKSNLDISPNVKQKLPTTNAGRFI